MKYPIAPGLSPNTDRYDAFAALRSFFLPFAYKQGKYIKIVEQWFCKQFSVPYAITFNSGRTALFATLQALGVGRGDEVIVQAFTCSVVPDAILSCGAKPIYVDIKKDYTMDPTDVKKKLSKKTKAIIVQHTFGIPSDVASIKALITNRHIALIEDSAHCISTTKTQDSFTADARFFSFGRDKAISCVFGGIVITQSDELGKNIRNFQKNTTYPSTLWIMQQLLHPILFTFLILPLYPFGFLGKVLLVLFQKMHFLSFPVTPEEKKGKLRKDFVKRLPNGLAQLAVLQLRKLPNFNKKREMIAEYYKKELQSRYTIPVTEKLPYLRFPLCVAESENLFHLAKKENISLGLWYKNVIDPKDTVLSSVGYMKGMCPNAEKLAYETINLPTYPRMTMEDAKTVVSLLQGYDNNTPTHR